MLKVKKLDPKATLPTVGHPGEDLGFDLYALEDTYLWRGMATSVRTGIAATFSPEGSSRKFGLIIKDRSSMAAKGTKTSAGVVDAGYQGELKVIMTNTSMNHALIKAGEKIAQMMPQEVFTGAKITEVTELGESSRGEGGFGSTGS